jgi:hypothetical protein
MLQHSLFLCAEGKNRTLAQAEGGCLREAQLAGFGSWGSKTSVFRGVFGMETEKPLVPRRFASWMTGTFESCEAERSDAERQQ